MAFKGAKMKVRDIANEVNVQFVLEGSVRKAGSDLRISVQLIDALNDTNLWAEKFNGTLDDVFEIQEMVSRSVVNKLKMTFEKGERKLAPNLLAYDLYLLGRYYWNKRTEEGLKLSIDYFKQAIDLDGNYALAYSGLSDSYYVCADWNYLPYILACEKSRELAMKAISLNNNIAEAHATLAGIADNLEYNYVKAESLFQASIRLNPNYSTGLQWYADFLARLGRFDEALMNIDQALQLDPLSPMKNFACGFIYYYAGKYDKAILKFNDTLKIDKWFPYLRFLMFLTYIHNRQNDEAVNAYREVLTDQKTLEEYDLNAARICKTKGLNEFIDYITVIELKNPQPSTRYLAIFYSLSGNTSEALNCLEYNVANFVSEYQYMNVEPSFKGLRSEPRFRALLRKIGYGE
jgi:adenylate cyclase